MNGKEKLRARLDKQREIEGGSKDLDLLYVILDVVVTESDWRAMTVCRHHRYGTLSYETHRFYDPSPLLRRLVTTLGEQA